MDFGRLLNRTLAEAEEEDKLFVVEFNYDSNNDPKPSVYSLGSFVHPDTRNELLVGVNRHYFETGFSGVSSSHDSVSEVVLALQAAVQSYPMDSAATQKDVMPRVRKFRRLLAQLAADDSIFPGIFRYYYMDPEFMNSVKVLEVPFRTVDEILDQMHRQDLQAIEAEKDSRLSAMAAKSVVKKAEMARIPYRLRERVSTVYARLAQKAIDDSINEHGEVRKSHVGDYIRDNFDEAMKRWRLPLTFDQLDGDPDFAQELTNLLTNLYYKSVRETGQDDQLEDEDSEDEDRPEEIVSHTLGNFVDASIGVEETEEEREARRAAIVKRVGGN